jgi:plastocyanin
MAACPMNWPEAHQSVIPDGSYYLDVFQEVDVLRAREPIAGLIALLIAAAPAVVRADQRPIRTPEGSAQLVEVERVRVVNFAFRPKSLTISDGTKVRWVVREGTHSTTSNNGRWDSGVLSQGEAFGRVFRRAGTFRYHCSVHPSAMRGVIIVK